MERRAGLLSAAITTLMVGFIPLAGCSGSEVTVTVTRYHPAAMPLPPAVRMLLIRQFISPAREDRELAALVQQKLSAALRRPQIAKRFQEVFGPKRADAVISGTVTANRTAQNGQSNTSKPATRRVEVTFNVVDMQSGQTVLTSAISRHEQCPAGAQATLGGLIGQCVDEFVADLMPHEVLIPVILADVKGTIAREAGAMAAAGRYDRALDYYKRALLQSEDDHGILFNAGVMHEIKGNLVRASGLYARALQIEPKEKYQAALRRVQR